jgi:hypothetical protein
MIGNPEVPQAVFLIARREHVDSGRLKEQAFSIFLELFLFQTVQGF